MDSSRADGPRPSLMGRMRGSSAGAAARFPLATDFFARVVAPPEQNRRWEHLAEQLRTDAVRSAKWSMSYEDGLSGWKLSSSKKHFRDTGMRTYCKKPDAAARLVQFKCMGKVAMSLQRTMDAVYADNTLDFRSNATFLMENCLDAAVLHVASRGDEIEPHSYVGINWVAVRSPGLFSKSRDFCYLRSTGTMQDKDKHEVGYVVMHSVDVRECPSLELSLGLVRTTISGVLLFKESADVRHTDVLWQGSSPGAGAASSGKLMALMHETFTSYVTNLNRFREAKFLAQQLESRRSHALAKGSARKHCYMCFKRFTLIRPRYACGMCAEDVCKDCGTTSRVKTFDGERPSSLTRGGDAGAAHFCKRCTHTARKEAANQSEPPAFFSTTHSIFSDAEPSDATAEEESFERLSALSSSPRRGTVRSLQQILSERSMTALVQEQRASARAAPPAPQSLPEFATDFSTSQVPLSPLWLRTHREKGGRNRLETDPMESYDAYDYSDDDVEVVEVLDTSELREDAAAARSSYSYNNNNNASPATTRHSYSSSSSSPAAAAFGGDTRRSSYENRDRDLAARLREISAKAQETLDTTRRNSCLMSDTSSAPRTSELLAFQQLDQSIAEQAEMLNVIGFVSTGRVYMETNGPEAGGVRISESSDILSDSERFEVLT
ncbi:hypothetical protein PybrP1_005406 [[Pythium] brassicae (nom. inval.)]|nr:hypothetical protein PybrP1_005406 [[Pythium] brassicae (nom. inval.)]